MKISDKDFEVFQDWFSKNLHDFPCEICSKKSSEVKLSMPTTIFRVESLDRRTVYPVIILGCECCGNTRLISAVHLERLGCPIFNFLPKKKNVFSFLDYFKRKK